MKRLNIYRWKFLGYLKEIKELENFFSDILTIFFSSK